MLRRYYAGLGVASTSGGDGLPSLTTWFVSMTTTAETGSTIDIDVRFVGAPGSTVTFKVSSLMTNGTGTLTIDGVSKGRTETFTSDCDGSGDGLFSAHIDIDGLVGGGGSTYVRAIIDIIAVSAGTIDGGNSEVQLYKSI